MFTRFNTIEEYRAKNLEISTMLGYPNSSGTISYSTSTPLTDLDDKFVMEIIPGYESYFTGCEIVDKVDYPLQLQNNY